MLARSPLLPNHPFVLSLKNTALERGFSWGKQEKKKKGRTLMTVKVLQKHPDLKEIIRADISLLAENC